MMERLQGLPSQGLPFGGSLSPQLPDLSAFYLTLIVAKSGVLNTWSFQLNSVWQCSAVNVTFHVTGHDFDHYTHPRYYQGQALYLIL